MASLVPCAEIWIFGSRVQNQAEKYSDLDILLKGSEPIPLNVMFKLRAAFDESNLTFKVDLVDWYSVTPEFLVSILKEAQKIL